MIPYDPLIFDPITIVEDLMLTNMHELRVRTFFAHVIEGQSIESIIRKLTLV